MHEDDRPLFEKLPFTPPFWLEPKYDGIRAQLHKHGDDVSLFSRDLRPLDDEFPELLVSPLASWTAISSSTANSSPSPRAASSASRISRNASAGRMADGDLFLTDEGQDSSVPLRFIAFDLLWHNGEDLLGHPLLDRAGPAGDHVAGTAV